MINDNRIFVNSGIDNAKRGPKDLNCTEDGLGRPIGSPRVMRVCRIPPANVLHKFCSETPVLSSPSVSVHLRSNNGNYINTSFVNPKIVEGCTIHGVNCTGHQHYRPLPKPHILTSASIGKVVTTSDIVGTRFMTQIETKEALLSKTGFVRSKVKGYTRGIFRATAIPRKKIKFIGVPRLQWMRSKMECYTDNGMTTRSYTVDPSKIDLNKKAIFFVVTREPMLGIKSIITLIGRFVNGDAVSIPPLLMSSHLKGDFDGDELSFAAMLNEVINFELESRLCEQCKDLSNKIKRGEYKDTQIVFHKGRIFKSSVWDYGEGKFDEKSDEVKEVSSIKKYKSRTVQDDIRDSSVKLDKNIIKNKLTSDTGSLIRTVSESLMSFTVHNRTVMYLNLKSGISKTELITMSSITQHVLTRELLKLVAVVMQESLKVKIIGRSEKQLIQINPVGELIGFGDIKNTMIYICYCDDHNYFKCKCRLIPGRLKIINLTDYSLSPNVDVKIGGISLKNAITYNLSVLKYQYNRIIITTEVKHKMSADTKVSMKKVRVSRLRQLKARIWSGINMLGVSLNHIMTYEGVNELSAAMYLMCVNGFISFSDPKLKASLKWNKRIFAMNYETPHIKELDTKVDQDDLDSLMNRQASIHNNSQSSYVCTLSYRDILEE